MSLYIGVQSSSWGISAEGDIAVGTVVRDHLAAVNAERYEAATQETETSTEYTQETDSSTGCPGYHIILRHSPGGGGENYNSMHRFLPGGDVRLTMRTDNVDGSVTEDITCHGWRCDHLGMEYEVYNTYKMFLEVKFTYLHHLWGGSVVGLLWLLHVVENIIVIISTFT